MNNYRLRGQKSYAETQNSGVPSSVNFEFNHQSSGVFPPPSNSMAESSRSDLRSSAFAATQSQSPLATALANIPLGSGKGGSLSRRSSGSHSIQNISDTASGEDSDGDTVPSGGPKTNQAFRERRREAHTQAEQKRRDAIKKGYQELEEELPTFQEAVGSQKPSKALVLQRSIDYVNYLEEQKRKQIDELDSLKNDYLGLQIMKQTYEKMAAASRNLPDQGNTPVSDEVKFKVFQNVMDNLFQTFDARISANSFADLSGTAFNWLEEWCTPQSLRSITGNVLNDLKNRSTNQQ